MRQVHAGIQGGDQKTQQGEGGLGAAFFDSPDLAGRHVCAAGQACDAEAQGATLIIDGLAEGRGFADGGPLRIFCSPGGRTQRVWQPVITPALRKSAWQGQRA